MTEQNKTGEKHGGKDNLPLVTEKEYGMKPQTEAWLISECQQKLDAWMMKINSSSCHHKR